MREGRPRTVIVVHGHVAGVASAAEAAPSLGCPARRGCGVHCRLRARCVAGTATPAHGAAVAGAVDLAIRTGDRALACYGQRQRVGYRVLRERSSGSQTAVHHHHAGIARVAAGGGDAAPGGERPAAGRRGGQRNRRAAGVAGAAGSAAAAAPIDAADLAVGAGHGAVAHLVHRQGVVRRVLQERGPRAVVAVHGHVAGVASAAGAASSLGCSARRGCGVHCHLRARCVAGTATPAHGAAVAGAVDHAIRTGDRTLARYGRRQHVSWAGESGPRAVVAVHGHVAGVASAAEPLHPWNVQPAAGAAFIVTCVPAA